MVISEIHSDDKSDVTENMRAGCFCRLSSRARRIQKGRVLFVNAQPVTVDGGKLTWAEGGTMTSALMPRRMFFPAGDRAASPRLVRF